MGLIYELTPDFMNVDLRGKLVQLVHADSNVGGYSQVNYIESVADAVRGYHYHKFNREAFYITKGSLEIAVWKVDGNGISEKETFALFQYKQGDFFGIEPFTVHVFTYLEDSALVALYDKGVELGDGSKDIWKVSEEDFLLMKGGSR